MPSRRTIAVLEDDPERIAHFRPLLVEHFPQYELAFFEHAGEMTSWLESHFDEVVGMALDNDLPLRSMPDGTTQDCGEGREVADWLATRPPRFPIVIHSTNTWAVEYMLDVLGLAGWRIERVIPFPGTRWMTRYWIGAVRGLLENDADARD
ncbi:cyclic-phosphate processing receiver domain-containing protein [Rubinisphaera margarita]|uniref:cyclic-phosphate processing receiver domain-containing protein n=1 Tax=Rubinisphaera margarita TaxID=2909586 RepID=UPI001EE7AC2C|nr:cyclic-phosphate processing receiver domain-containing protein [Rubinisphaera margarita]MCG6155536.1 hypothetical protein [Rubinisphaera margarita]